VIYLGANVPEEQLDSTLATLEPNLLILTAQHIASAASLLDLAEHFSQSGVRIAFGGLIFNRNPQLHHKFPGYYLGAKIRNAVNTIEEIIFSSPPIPNPVAIPEPYLAALDSFLAQHNRIEILVNNRLEGQGIPIQHLPLINQYMSQHIQAALRLGNLDYLGSEFAWVSSFIQNYQLKPSVLKAYLSVYYQAAKDLLDERGNLLVAWLSQNYLKFNGGQP